MPPPTTLDAAIVICAYTQARWDDTIAAIASAMAQAPSSGVVVVVDHEDALFQRLVEADTGARVIQSAGPRGLSGARNTGVAAVEADVVAFLDDDARAEPGWLDALLRPYEDASVVATGGLIVPVFDGGRPSWLAEELDWIVGCTYRGMPRVQADVRNVIGAGMSVRRAAFEAVGGFDTSLGRGLGLPVGGEETTLCIRARRLVPGARVVFEPAASVSHRVPSGRRTIGYALRRAWAEGLTKARVARLEGPSASLSTERAYVARILPAAVLRELWDAVGRRDASALGRAAVIVAVLGAASVGFAAERVAQAAGKLRASARLPRAATSRPDGRDATAGDRPLRILQVTPRYDPFVGGVETHTQEVARRLAARGHRVTVLTTDPGASLPRRERVDGVEIVRVRAFPATRDWYLAPGLVAMIGRPRWDVVHIQGVHTLVPPLGALTAILASRRFVLTFHTGGHSSRVRTSARSLQWRLLAPILRRAAALVAVSRFEAEQFAEAFGIANDRIELIRNGSEAGTPGALAAPGTDMLSSIPDGAPLILSPGRLERYKGHHRVVAAMPAVREALPDARLHLAGTGAYEPDLRRQVAELGLEEAVTIGPIARERMPDAFARASVVALLSEYESHPVAVMEALAARRRVVVADTSGFRELAEDGLVRAIPLDACPDDAAAAILHELDRAAPESGPPLPTWDDTTDRLEALYRRIVGA